MEILTFLQNALLCLPVASSSSDICTFQLSYIVSSNLSSLRYVNLELGQAYETIADLQKQQSNINNNTTNEQIQLNCQRYYDHAKLIYSKLMSLSHPIIETLTSKLSPLEYARQCGNVQCNEFGKFQCTQCKNVRYCSRECQLLHWKLSHKKECKQKQETK
jgi:hypothetical protein